MKPRTVLLPILLLAALPLMAGPLLPPVVTHPAEKRPGSLGFSFSELTGVGLNYRYLDSEGGWQVSGMASAYTGFGPDWYFSAGGAKHSVLFSYVVNEWFYSQFYWLGGLAWRTQKNVTEHSEWMSGTNDVSGRWRTWTTTRWRNVLTAGPALGLELGFVEQFSFNVEVGYKVGYDFSEADPKVAFTAQPGFSAMFLFRY